MRRTKMIVKLHKINNSLKILQELTSQLKVKSTTSMVLIIATLQTTPSLRTWARRTATYFITKTPSLIKFMGWEPPQSCELWASNFTSSFWMDKWSTWLEAHSRARSSSKSKTSQESKASSSSSTWRASKTPSSVPSTKTAAVLPSFKWSFQLLSGAGGTMSYQKDNMHSHLR